jgi:hypothetical protein
VSVTVSAGVALTDAGQLAFLDRWEGAAYALGYELDDGEYARVGRLAEHAWLFAAGWALLLGPGLAVVTAAGLSWLFGRHNASPGFRTALGVTVHAGVVLAFRQVAMAAAALVSTSGPSVFSAAFWLPGVGPSGPAATALGLIDAFAVWWLALLAVGAGVLYGRRALPLAATLAAVYAGIAVLAGAAAVAGRQM